MQFSFDPPDGSFTSRVILDLIQVGLCGFHFPLGFLYSFLCSMSGLYCSVGSLRSCCGRLFSLLGCRFHCNLRSPEGKSFGTQMLCKLVLGLLITNSAD